jgi:hypothetical protein
MSERENSTTARVGSWLHGKGRLFAAAYRKRASELCYNIRIGRLMVVVGVAPTWSLDIERSKRVTGINGIIGPYQFGIYWNGTSV